MDLEKCATTIVKKLQDNGHIAYFAGGWVRDYLLGTPSFDIDIASSASPEEVQKLFNKTVPIGINFGIILVIEDSHPFEVAMFRIEEGGHDGRRPTSVKSCCPEKDAQRRDFTINGMFYDPITKTVYDYVGGKKDLADGVIRTIGRAKDRFDEDRLRMIRAIRYACRFEFGIDQETIDAILHHAHQLFPSVSIERVCAEFDKLHLTSHFKEGMVLMHQFHLLQQIFPHTNDITTNELNIQLQHVPYYPKSLPLIAFLLPMFEGYSLEDKSQLCISLKRPNKEREYVRQHHQLVHYFNQDPKCEDIVTFVELASSSYFKEIFSVYVLSLSDPESFQQHVSFLLSEYHFAIQRRLENNPLVKAEHLIKRGIVPGKKLGELLKKAEQIAILQKSDDLEQVISSLLSPGSRSS